MRGRRSALALAALALLPCAAGAQARVLDAFESVDAWTAAPSDGVRLAIASDSGHRGRGMRLDVDFQGGGGYAVVRRAVPIDYPENFEFAFWVRGDIPPNNLEFKLVDASGENVWWVNRRDFRFPERWTQVVLKRRHIGFAWGPLQDHALRRTATLEIAITAGQGGRGSVWLDELTFTPREAVRPYAGTPRVTVTPAGAASTARLALDGDTTTAWEARAAPGRDTTAAARGRAASATQLQIDFGQVRELGGLVLLWAPGAHATDYAVLRSPDGAAWDTAYVVRGGGPGRHFIPMPETEARHLRLALRRGAGATYALREVDVRPLAFGESVNALYFAAADHAPRGSYPRAFTDSVQSYWTITGAPFAEREAMMDEEGSVEVGKGRFSIAPFLAVGGRLLTWADARRTPSLVGGYLPIPALRWDADSL